MACPAPTCKGENSELQHNTDALHAAMRDTILVNNAIKQRRGGEM